MYLNSLSARSTSAEDDPKQYEDAPILFRGESKEKVAMSVVERGLKESQLKSPSVVITTSISLSNSNSDLSDCDSVEATTIDRMTELLAKHADLPIDAEEVLTDMEVAMRLRRVDAALAELHDVLVRRAGLYGRRDGPFVDPDEPMTHPDATRYALSDRPDQEIQELVKKQEASTWFTAEIDLASDKFEDLDNNTKFFLENVLAFFAASDGIVADNICKNVQDSFTVPEVRQFFACQNFMETIHSETYGLLLQTYVRDDARRRELREAIRTLPCVQKKAQWALHWARPHHSLAERVVA